MTRQPGIPLRPDRSFARDRALSTLVRSVIVAAAGKLNPATTSENFVREKWGAEEIREIATVLRAASSPASPTQTGWAAELAQTSVALMAALQPPISAGAALLQRGLQIDFGRDAAIRLPAIDAAMQASRNAFLYKDILASVTAANKHAGDRFKSLYQWTIDSGAHPNERAVTANLRTIEEADRLTVQAVLLHGDDIYLDAALMTAARCGLNCLEMLQVIYNAKFEILGINAAMLQLRKGLWN